MPYPVPDKSPGDLWPAAEHNLLKQCVNDTESRVDTAETGLSGAQTDVAALQTSQSAQDTAIAANAATSAANSVGVQGNANAIVANDADIAFILGRAQPIGVWDASLNFPSLGTATNDHFYIVQTPGTTNINGNSNWLEGDIVYGQGGQWVRISAGAATATAIQGLQLQTLANANGLVANDADIAALLGRGEPLGIWDAALNFPSLNTPAKDNDWYVVGNAGSTDLNGQTTWNIGDLLMGSGGQWVRVPSGSGMTDPQTATNTAAIATLSGQGEPLGLWDANSNTPDLTTAPTSDNDFYFVGTPGTTTINGESTWNEGDAVVSVGGAWVRVAGASAGAMPNVFTPAGDYNASTNTPDMSVAANRVDGTEFKTYLVSTTGTQDLGNGAEEFEAGGQITWFSATSYRYDAPFKNGSQVGTAAQRLATGTGDLDAGNTWFETDTGISYVWGGSAWIPTSIGSVIATNFGTATGTSVPAGSILYIDGVGLYRNTSATTQVFSAGNTNFATIAEENRFKGSLISTTQLTARPYAGLKTGDTWVMQDTNKVYTWNPTATTGGLSPDDVGVNTGQWMENKSGLTDTTLAELLAATPTTANDSQVSATTLREVLRIHVGGGDNLHLGPNSGVGDTGTNTVFIGQDAGTNSTGINCVGVGPACLDENTGVNSVAVGSQALQNNSGDNSVGIGRAAGLNNAGLRQTAAGLNAGRDNAGTDQIAYGVNSGRGNSGANQISIGNNSGTDNTGTFQICIGQNAGDNNTTINQVAIGSQAGTTNSGLSQTCVGAQSGQGNSGDQQVAYGPQSGQNNTANNQVAIGVMAGADNTSLRQVAIGADAGRNASGADQIVAGFEAGLNSSGDNVIALGESAGNGNTNSNVTILGNLELPRFAGVAAANAALPAAPGPTSAGSVYLWIDTSDGNAIKARI